MTTSKKYIGSDVSPIGQRLRNENRNAIEIESITQAIFKKLKSDSNFDGDIALGFNDGQIFIEFENDTYEIAINTYNN